MNQIYQLSNLGNSLTNSGRIIEAIRLYKSVLNINSNFPQALIGYADDLDYWSKVCAAPKTISLYLKIYLSYKSGLKSGTLPMVYKHRVKDSLIQYESLLKELKFDFNTIEQEEQISKAEYRKHSPIRKFCIDHFLVLNEHVLFCQCSEVETDNLSIVHSNISLYGEKIGKMELLLNRLKSEFNVARKLYYEGVNSPKAEEETLYTDLFDREMIGENVEKIRTSFRLCFGIFDKIAHGICYFFDLPKAKNEKIYFDRFWESNKERQEVIKKVRNPHILALYSIANDLNSLNGEFGFYKQWRNKLEHGNLILMDKNEEVDLLKLFDDDKFITQVSFNLFKDEALHLLQICCAAIFSYVYSIRMASLHNDSEKPTVPFIIQPKY